MPSARGRDGGIGPLPRLMNRQRSSFSLVLLASSFMAICFSRIRGGASSPGPCTRRGCGMMAGGEAPYSQLLQSVAPLESRGRRGGAGIGGAGCLQGLRHALGFSPGSRLSQKLSACCPPLAMRCFTQGSKMECRGETGLMEDEADDDSVYEYDDYDTQTIPVVPPDPEMGQNRSVQATAWWQASDVTAAVGRANAERGSFGAFARKHPMVVFEEVGDGACLFRSLARQVKNDEEKHMEVRQEIVDFLEQVLNTSGPSRLPSDPARPAVYPLPPRTLTHEQMKHALRHARCFFRPKKPDQVRAYLRKMRNPATWGTSLEALAAAYVYKRPVLVWMTDLSGDPDYLNPENTTSLPIGLLHVRDNHWNSATLADDAGAVYGRNLSSWISASMALLRLPNDSECGGEDGTGETKPHKYLLLRTSANEPVKWTMPWGNLRQNETLLNAAVRRLSEEVGYDADKGEVVCKVQSMMTREMSGCQCKGQPVMYVCSIFLMELNSTMSGVSSAINPKYNASWFYPDEVRQFEEKGEVQALISAAVEQAENWNVTNDPYASYASNENSDYTEDESEAEARREANPAASSAAVGGNSNSNGVGATGDATKSGGGAGTMAPPSASPLALDSEGNKQVLDPLRRLMHPRHRRQRRRPSSSS